MGPQHLLMAHRILYSILYKKLFMIFKIELVLILSFLSISTLLALFLCWLSLRPMLQLSKLEACTGIFSSTTRENLVNFLIHSIKICIWNLKICLFYNTLLLKYMLLFYSIVKFVGISTL